MSLAKCATADPLACFFESHHAAKLTHVRVHPALDMARARQFYEQKLGLQAKQEINGGVVFEFGKGTGCFMYPTPNAGTSKSSQAFWTVDDIAQEVAELKKRGVQFEHYDMPELKREGDIYIGGGARAAWFKDSEGNTLAIIQNETR
jgi:predicted enzyme related to lactoylglutathione lyase